jgi:hypothetical protein
VTVIQARVDKAQAVLDARAALHTAILANEAEDAQSAPYARSLRQSVVAMFANSPSILAEFRLAARKPPTPLTAAQKVLAAARRAATRAARHTMGSVQKAALTGHLKDPVVVALVGTASTSNGSSSSATPPPASPPAAPAITNGSTPQS